VTPASIEPVLESLRPRDSGFGFDLGCPTAGEITDLFGVTGITASTLRPARSCDSLPPKATTLINATAPPQLVLFEHANDRHWAAAPDPR
jgi:hypothetical protein